MHTFRILQNELKIIKSFEVRDRYIFDIVWGCFFASSNSVKIHHETIFKNYFLQEIICRRFLPWIHYLYFCNLPFHTTECFSYYQSKYASIWTLNHHVTVYYLQYYSSSQNTILFTFLSKLSYDCFAIRSNCNLLI